MSKLYNIEFRKTLKKPISIIGTFLLILLMIALAFSFNPVKVVENKETDTPTLNIYDEYIDEISPAIQQTINETKNIINYYNALKTRQDKLQELTNSINIEFENLEIVKTKGNNDEINEQGSIIFDSLKEYTNLLATFPDMSHIDYIYNISVYDDYVNNMYFTNMREWTSHIETFVNNNNENLGNQVYTLLVTNNFNTVLEESLDIAINFINYTLTNHYNKITQNYNIYKEYINSSTNATFRYVQANNNLEKLKTNIYDFEKLYSQIMAYDYDIIITKQENIDSISNSLIMLNEILSTTGQLTRAEHQEMLKQLSSTSFISVIKNFNENLTIVAPDNEIVLDLNEYITLSEENYNTNEKNIISSYESNDSLNLQKNINKQVYLAESLIELINDTINIACYEEYSIYERYIDNNQIYDANCGITLAKYYITNNNYPTDVINNYQFNYQVNEKISCYDYIIFALKIATIAIILIQAINICSSISGERKNGNLRMLLMSPNKRSTIFNSKYFSIISSTLLMFVISIITSGITGVLIFGEEIGQIITVFNATTVIEIEPIMAILINFIFQILECISFISLFWIFSITIKNFALSTSLSIFSYLACIGLSKINWNILSIFPSNNFNLNKYFYSKTYTSNNILNKLFDPTSYSIQNFYLSLIITLIFIIVMYLINIKVFKKKSY